VQGDVVKVSSHHDINALFGYSLELAFTPDCKKLVAISNVGIVQVCMRVSVRASVSLCVQGR
jgi:hypothetical protein